MKFTNFDSISVFYYCIIMEKLLKLVNLWYSLLNDLERGFL